MTLITKFVSIFTDDKKKQPKMILEPFIQAHKPDVTVKADNSIIEKYKGKVPESLLELWKNFGFGTYNEGLIQIINPDEYYDTMATWLGKRPPNYIPIALGAFGDFFYYRRLTENDEDVCVLDPHFKKIHTIVWSLEEFFNSFLTDKEVISRNLASGLYEKSKLKNGPLKPNNIMMFVPSLAMGGSMSWENTEPGNAIVHLNLLFQF